MSYYYPPVIKTVLKTGAIVHLLTTALGLFLAGTRVTTLIRNDRPRRRAYKQGKMGLALSTRDQRHREVIRPLLDSQPAKTSESLFRPFDKSLD